MPKFGCSALPEALAALPGCLQLLTLSLAETVAGGRHSEKGSFVDLFPHASTAEKGPTAAHTQDFKQVK